MSYLSSIIRTRLEEKISKLNKLRPLPKSAVQKLREKFQIEMTYNSNAIEGNSLTLKETFLVINEGITVKGKPLKDHLEAKNHHTALQYLYGLVEKGRRLTMSEHLIRSLHKMRELIEWARKNKKRFHVIELSALLHHKLVHIHPFFDGNGRTARLTMNLLLMQSGFSPCYYSQK